MKLTADRLREVLLYDPERGIFRWRASRGRVKAGNVAGSDDHGYTRISIDGKDHMAHRLAWLYMTGRFPQIETDHIDRHRSNNRFGNLREATHTSNQQNNDRPHSNNSTGLLGVIPLQGRYLARIRVNGKKKGLGTFDTPEAAHAAYMHAKRELHPGYAANSTKADK